VAKSLFTKSKAFILPAFFFAENDGKLRYDTVLYKAVSSTLST
jgi:hypothetical protein